MVDQIYLWKWRFTNEFGKRVESSWRMTEETVREYPHVYRGARKSKARSRSDTDGVNERLSAIAAQVHAGQQYECAWDLFRFGQLKAATHEKAAAEFSRMASTRRRLTAIRGA